MDRTQLAREGLEAPTLHRFWEDTFLVSEPQRRFFDIVFNRLHEVFDDGEVVDAGCGLGHHSIRLALEGWQVRAFDFSPAAVEQARENVAAARLVDRISVAQDDLLGLSLPSDSIERMICWGVLMHVPDLAMAVAELSRVLASGGTLVVSELNANSPEARLIRLRGRAKGNAFEVKPSGPERWQTSAGREMLIRHADPDWLVSEFARHGVTLHDRVTGQFSESYTTLPWLEGPIGWMNRRLVWTRPRGAVSNIFIFKS